MIKTIDSNTIIIKSVCICFLFICCVVLFVLIPPTNSILVGLFILLITLLIYTIASVFLVLKYQILITAGIFLFLTINYIAGFQLLNTLLLISFIIGISILMSNNKKKTTEKTEPPETEKVKPTSKEEKPVRHLKSRP
jgi:predicted membrane protein